MPKYTYDFPSDAISAIKAKFSDEEKDGLTDKEIVNIWINRELRRPMEQYTHEQDVASIIATELAAREASEAAFATEKTARVTAEAAATEKAAGIVVS